MGNSVSLYTMLLDYSAMVCTDTRLIVSRFISEGDRDGQGEREGMGKVEFTMYDFVSDVVAHRTFQGLCLPISSMHILRDRILVVFMQKIGIKEFDGVVFVMDLACGDLQQIVSEQSELTQLSSDGRASDVSNYAIEVLSDRALVMAAPPTSHHIKKELIMITFRSETEFSELFPVATPLQKPLSRCATM